MSKFNNIEMCRVCLDKINNLVNIFSPHNEHILLKLRAFVEVKVYLHLFLIFRIIK